MNSCVSLIIGTSVLPKYIIIRGLLTVKL